MSRMETILYLLAVMTPWLAYLSWSDVKYRRLPNLWTLGMLGGALFGRLVLGGIPSVVDGITAGLLCGGFLLLPFLMRGAGGGDVKMIAAAGVLLGLSRVGIFLFATSIAGLLLVIAMIVLKQSDPARLKHYFLCLFWIKYDRKEGRRNLPSKDSEKSRVPFGVAIALGVWFSLAYELLLLKGGRS